MNNIRIAAAGQQYRGNLRTVRVKREYDALGDEDTVRNRLFRRYRSDHFQFNLHHGLHLEQKVARIFNSPTNIGDIE